ncbi:hypothetical protein LT493_43920 [Streptomyces tricolor]|nr:hypothetical protein [Streptomyces tricolor]
MVIQPYDTALLGPTSSTASSTWTPPGPPSTSTTRTGGRTYVDRRDADRRRAPGSGPARNAKAAALHAQADQLEGPLRHRHHGPEHGQRADRMLAELEPARRTEDRPDPAARARPLRTHPARRDPSPPRQVLPRPPRPRRGGPG